MGTKRFVVYSIRGRAMSAFPYLLSRVLRARVCVQTGLLGFLFWLEPACLSCRQRQEVLVSSNGYGSSAQQRTVGGKTVSEFLVNNGTSSHWYLRNVWTRVPWSTQAGGVQLSTVCLRTRARGRC